MKQNIYLVKIKYILKFRFQSDLNSIKIAYKYSYYYIIHIAFRHGFSRCTVHKKNSIIRLTSQIFYYFGRKIRSINFIPSTYLYSIVKAFKNGSQQMGKNHLKKKIIYRKNISKNLVSYFWMLLCECESIYYLSSFSFSDFLLIAFIYYELCTNCIYVQCITYVECTNCINIYDS